MTMFTSFSGYRTYIFAAAGAAVVFCLLMGWVDNETADMLLAVLGFGGLAALRAAK